MRFADFVAATDASDTSIRAQLWRLGAALFDEIDLQVGDDVERSVSEIVRRMRREQAFSRWLADAVGPLLEEDLRASANVHGRSSASAIFTLLTGNQVERACQAALSTGDIRLATLLAQAGCRDDEFREDVLLQLSKWREYNVDPQIAPIYRRIYELLCGNVNVSKGTRGHGKADSSEDVLISEGLDWKRALGMRLWYADPTASISQAVARYESDVEQEANRVAKPVPSYISRKWQVGGQDVGNINPDTLAIRDGLFQVIKLFSSATPVLDDILEPRCYTSSPLDYTLPWHLHQIFARSLGYANIADVDQSGYSIKADELTHNYADQLERAGLWQWSAFLYLHLTFPESRRKAVVELLERNAGSLDDDDSTVQFLTSELHLPESLIDQARRQAEVLSSSL